MVGTTVIELPPAVVEHMAGHAARSWPEECCGILIGAGSTRLRVRQAVAAENLSPDPTCQYVVAPGTYLEAWRTAESLGADVVGFYHSHPNGDACPSELDRTDAWPATSYVILGLEGRQLRSVRSWRLDGSDLVEELVVNGTENL